MNANCFTRLLRELDVAAAAEHSVLNHHVDGMDYLCLHRSDKLTVKLYFIDPERMQHVPNTYLVTPHTHRYSFESTVLAGALVHARFREVEGEKFDRFEYAPEVRTRVNLGCIDLAVDIELHMKGSSYWCDTCDIHTLLVPNKPVLLGLVQFGDTSQTSTVYLRHGGQMRYPESQVPAKERVMDLRNQALEMMEGA